MHLVLFTHPEFLAQQSMPRYAKMLQEGMTERGHSVEVWSPKSRAYNLPFGKSLKKWLGYVDQFIIFPIEIKSRLKKLPANTLFVFSDHALGPWVSYVKNKDHVIHCHDFLAQHSALGLIAENPTSWTGCMYQKMIRKGYSQGKNFISVSKNTSNDLHKILNHIPKVSEIIYNGLNQTFEPGNVTVARQYFSNIIYRNVSDGFLLHIGGNSWYKNRGGVINIYNCWRKFSKHNLPLILIGSEPTAELKKQKESSSFKNDIFFIVDLEDKGIINAYIAASVFLFPSLAEGFGWPIAEAMASGCPVITTDMPPMTEVAGDAGFLIPRMPSDVNKLNDWGSNAAVIIESILDLDRHGRHDIVKAGLKNASRFNTQNSLDKIEKIYLEISEGAYLKTVDLTTKNEISVTT